MKLPTRIVLAFIIGVLIMPMISLAQYASDLGPLQLTAITSIENDDALLVGDASDSNELLKQITWTNFKTLVTTHVEGLSSYFDVTSDDTDDITEGATNLFYTTARVNTDAPNVTLAGEDFLSLSTQQITANAINPDNLSASDFGDFTCNGTSCSFDASTVSDGEIDYSTVTLDDLTFDVGSVSKTEFGYLNGVTSALQTQIDGKQATLGNNDITPDMVLSTGQTDEYVLTYEATGDTWEWAAAASASFTDIDTDYGAETVSSIWTLSGNWVNTANPWADNEVSDTLTIGSGSSVADGALSANVSLLGSTISVGELASADFGDFTCNGVTCSLDTSYQPLDAGLTSIAGLTTAADRMIYTTAADTYAVTTLSSFGRSLIDDAAASNARTTLGLGSLATLSTINNGNWSGTDLSVANGGTGASTFTTGGVLFGNGTSAFTNSGVLTNGQLLIGDGTGAPTVAALTAGTGIGVSNGAGSITLSADLGTAIDTSEITDDTITHADIADSDQATTMCIYIEDPTADDDLNSIWANKTANDFLLTELWAESDQTVNLDLGIDDGTVADVNGTDISPAAGEAEDTSLSGDTTLASGEELDLLITSVSGTPTWVSICWTGHWLD